MNESDRERFWKKVDRSNGKDACWNWLAGTRSGYGRFRMNGRHGYTVSAHRVAWELLVGQIPPDLWVLHRCDNRRCCNPGHLFLGTHAENMADMKAKGRARWGSCPGYLKARPGEKNGRARLSVEQVHELRRLYSGGVKRKLIAEQFGLPVSYVWSIATGRAWRSA